MQGVLGVDNMALRRYLKLPRSLRSGVVALGLVAFVMSVLGIGCRQHAGASLKSRVQEYWELKQSKQWERVYDDYLDPKRKETLSREAFVKRRLMAFDVLAFRVTDIRERGEQATVNVENDVNIPLRGTGQAVEMRKQTVTTEDEWARRDGTWYVSLTE